MSNAKTVLSADHGHYAIAITITIAMASQPELGDNPVSLRAPNRPLSGSVAFLGHLGLNTVQELKGKAKNPLNGARQ
jgi:hypothetical protein